MNLNLKKRNFAAIKYTLTMKHKLILVKVTFVDLNKNMFDLSRKDK